MINRTSSSQDLGPASRTPTVAASSSTNDHLEEVLKGQAQQAEFLQHMWVQQSQMLQALQQQVCALMGAIQQLAETQTCSNGVDVRRDAAKDLARVVRDGSTPEGQRLREQLWVWLHLQDEEATEPVPKQLQSWLTGQKTQQRKEFKRNRRRLSSQTDLTEIFSTPRMDSSRSQTKTSHDDPDQPRRDGKLGRDHGDRTRQIGGHLKATKKTLDDNSQTPVRTLLGYVWAQ